MQQMWGGRKWHKLIFEGLTEGVALEEFTKLIPMGRSGGRPVGNIYGGRFVLSRLEII